MSYFTQPIRYFMLLYLFQVSNVAVLGQNPPEPVLTNCPNPGLGFNNFPVSVTIGSHVVTVTRTANTYAFNMNPGLDPVYQCGILIKPGIMLLFPYLGQGEGSVTFTFSRPVSNVQFALVTQSGQAGNQLTITAANAAVPVTPVLTVFNSSPNNCPARYSVSANIVSANSNTNPYASMVNVGNCYFTSLTIRNTSANGLRSWIDLRLCNAIVGRKSPQTRVLNSIDGPN